MITQSSTQCRSSVVAGAILTLALSATTGAFAQTAPAPANTQVVAPKQVGAWMVTGWSQGYCAGERPLAGGAGGAAPLQYGIVRGRFGYRLALISQDWELKPPAAFPIQLSAEPVVRTESNAIVGGPKLVMIELGSDEQFMKKLATAPMIEIKAAQATFKLPLQGFAEMLTEVESCFSGLKRPIANPFAPAEPKKVSTAQ